MTLPVPENSPEVNRAELTNKRLQLMIVAGIIVLVLGGLFSLYLRGKDAAKQSTIQHAVAVILASNERNDCRTAYNSDRNAVLEHASAVERRNVSEFGGFFLSEISTEKIQANKVELDEANAAAANLPTLNEMVDHGYTLNGVKHPPCPMVK